MGDGPLRGVRVLELAAVLAGPFAGSLLQRLGAEVVRRLIPSMDVVLHNSRPGRMERLGLSGPECLALNPRLVYVGMSGFGTSGPMASRPAYDAIGQSATGLLDLFAQGRPPFMGPSLGDMATGIMGAAGAFCGLAAVGRTGQGIVVETSMLESVIALIADAFTQFAASGAPPDDDVRSRLSQIYMMAGSDGRYIATHLSSTDKFFRNLLGALGLEHLASDPRFATYQGRIENYPELRAELEKVFVTRPSTEWEQVLIDADVPSSPVRSVGDVLVDPQVEFLGLFEHAGRQVPFLRAPWTFDGVRPPVDAHGPLLGEHTMDVLGTVVDADELAALRASRVVWTLDDYEASLSASGTPSDRNE